MQEPKNLYPSQVDSTNPTEFPYGEARDVTVSGDNTGTPWKEGLINDWFGFFNRMLSRYAVPPSGNRETAEESQLEQVTHIMGMRNQSAKNRPKIAYIAERGMSAAAPENTVPAYELAGNADFYGATASLRLTSDDAWVLMQDETVNRTTSLSGNVVTFPESSLTNLDAGSWFGASYYSFNSIRVPNLDTFLYTANSVNLFPILEVMVTSVTAGQAQTLISQVLNYYPDYSFTISCATEAVLQTIRAEDNKIHLRLIADYNVPAVDAAIGLGNCDLICTAGSIINIGNGSFDPFDVSYARENNVDIYSNEVLTGKAEESVIANGVIGIISNKIGGI